MRAALVALALWLGSSIACAQAPAPAELRVAIVIGNAAYAAAPLANPANDAKAMSDVLRGMGFTVIEAHDASKAQMQAALVQAGATLKGRNGVGLLYYAGHGLQLDWHNYMIPVDAQLGSAAEVPNHGIDLQTVIDAFRLAGTRMNILVLDACRDNPFPATASAKGLAPMDAPPGTLLAYATAPGNVAEDGDAKGGNGLYTQFLVKELQAPLTSIENVFKRVRLQVRRQSQGRQVPWESTSLEEDFYFDSGKPVTPPADAQRDAAFAAEKADWERIKGSTRADDFYAHLQRYPNGAISEQAQFRLEQLQKAGIVVQPGADGVSVLPASQARYRVGDHFTYRVSDFYGKEEGQRSLRVTQVSDTQVVVNDGKVVWDAMGNLITDAAGTRNPAKAWIPAELAIGKHWRSAYTVGFAGGSVSLYWDFKVAALEQLSVPAGRFTVYRVEGTSRISNGAYQTETLWIDPANFLMVRDDFVRRRGGQVEAAYRHELVSADRAKPGP